jgi:hypothetical protein
VRITILMALAAVGCSFHTSSGAPSDGQKDGRNDGPSDGPADGTPDTPPQQDFGSGAWQVHVDLPVPTNALTLPTMIDTGSASTDCMTNVHWVDPSQPDSCFIVAQTIATPTMPVNVRGTRPVVFVALDSITITSSLDAASHKMQMNGPGANDASCGSPSGGANHMMGGGGGAGGTFVTAGGNGGTGDGNGAAAGSTAGTPGKPTTLRGGCAGSDGGDGMVAMNRGRGAAGGGAIYLVAGNTITIAATGIVNASGAGAVGGGHQSGGGGGGSGGMIVLYAPAIDAQGKILANGGGGASGGDGSNGVSGSDEVVSDPLTAPGGGNGGGGDGGDGWTQGSSAGDGQNGTSNKGGGGGGGGGGYIRSNLDLPNANAVTPAVDVVP